MFGGNNMKQKSPTVLTSAKENENPNIKLTKHVDNSGRKLHMDKELENKELSTSIKFGQRPGGWIVNEAYKSRDSYMLSRNPIKSDESGIDITT